MKYQSFLIKYAEIGIKGKNRHIFEEALVRQIKHALKPCEHLPHRRNAGCSHRGAAQGGGRLHEGGIS